MTTALSPDLEKKLVPASSRPRRNTEAGLLAFAGLLGIAAYAEVCLAGWGALPNSFFLVSVIGVVLLGALHVLVRIFAPYADPILLPCAALLTMLGLVMIYRLDLGKFEKVKDPAKYVWVSTRQLEYFILALISFGVVLVLFAIVLSMLQKGNKFILFGKKVFTTRIWNVPFWIILAGLVGVILICSPRIPGFSIVEANGARIAVGKGPIRIQPAEFAKIALTIFFAGILVYVRRSVKLDTFKIRGFSFPAKREIIIVGIVWFGILTMLAWDKDFGTVLMFFGLFIFMLYIATGRAVWLIIGGVLLSVGAVLGYFMFSIIQQRFDNLFDPWATAELPGGGHQMITSLYGLADGGLFGKGLGRGLPDTVVIAESDYITSSFGEELGMAGLLAILVIYVILIERTLRTAIICQDRFQKLVTSGFATILALQVFAVVGGVVRILPLTGLVTPFLAAGGSALVANWIMLAMVFRVSDSSRRPLPLFAKVVEEGL